MLQLLLLMLPLVEGGEEQLARPRVIRGEWLGRKGGDGYMGWVRTGVDEREDVTNIKEWVTPW